MLRYILRRLIQAVPTVILVSVLVFLMLYLIPGDPAEVFVGESKSTPELIARIREEMGLNRPLYVQYLSFMGNVLKGDFGTSLIFKRPVLEELALRLPYTIELTVAAIILATTVGLILGIIAALNHNTIIDTAAMFLALLGISMPIFWSGLVMVIIFSINLRWFPPIGQGGLDRLILPASALGLLSAATLARLVRSSMLEVLGQEYIVTAKAKGLRRRAVVLRHALRNALIPIVTTLGLQFGQLIGGAVIAETIFQRLGVGRMLSEGVQNKDFPLVQGTVLFLATSYILINIIIDVLYIVIDPRIKFE